MHASYWHLFTAGSPRALTPPTYRMPRPCWKRSNNAVPQALSKSGNRASTVQIEGFGVNTVPQAVDLIGDGHAGVAVRLNLPLQHSETNSHEAVGCGDQPPRKSRRQSAPTRSARNAPDRQRRIAGYEKRWEGHCLGHRFCDVS